MRCISDKHFTHFGDEENDLGCDNSPDRGSYFCKNHCFEKLVDSYELEEE